jgi:hypothetical protein
MRLARPSPAFLIAFPLIALAACLLVLGVSRELQAEPVRARPLQWPACGVYVPSGGNDRDFARVLVAFAETSVLRRRPACYRRLVTRPLMVGVTPQDLRHGDLPVHPVPDVGKVNIGICCMVVDGYDVDGKLRVRAGDESLVYRIRVTLTDRGWKVAHVQVDARRPTAPAGGVS